MLRTTDLPGTSRQRWVSVGVPTAAMAMLGSWGLRRGSMFGSEADTYWSAQLGLGHLFRLLSHIDAVHGSYYLLMHAWFSVDVGPVWMRVPSVLAMSAAAGLTSVLATRLSGTPHVGLIAGLLMAFTPSVVAWSQSGRSYAIVTLSVAATSLELLRACSGDTVSFWPRWPRFAVLLTLTGYLHEMTLLLSVAFAVTLLWVRAPRAVIRHWMLSTAIAVLLVSPLLIVSAHERQAVGYLRPPGLAALQSLFHDLFGTADLIAYPLLACAGIGAMSLRRSRGCGRVTLAALAAPMLVVPPAILLVESRVGHPLYDSRYVLYSTVGAAMLAAAGVDRIGALLAAAVRSRTPRMTRVLRAGPALAACTAAIIVQWPMQQYLRTVASRREDYAGASVYLARHHHPGDALVFMKPDARSAKLGYPSDYLGLVDVAEARTPEQSGTFRGINKPAPNIIAAIRTHSRVWVLGPYPLRRNPRGLHGVAYLLRTSYRPATVEYFAGVTDVLYLRRGLTATAS